MVVRLVLILFPSHFLEFLEPIIAIGDSLSAVQH